MNDKPEAYPYSSYRSYISRTKEDIVSRDIILKMIAGDRKGAQKKYKEFVERMNGEAEENPHKKIYGGVILGDMSYSAVSRQTRAFLQRHPRTVAFEKSSTISTVKCPMSRPAPGSF